MQILRKLLRVGYRKLISFPGLLLHSSINFTFLTVLLSLSQHVGLLNTSLSLVIKFEWSFNPQHCLQFPSRYHFRCIFKFGFFGRAWSFIQSLYWRSVTSWSGTFDQITQIGFLSGNNITGIIPSSFAKLCNLQKLSLMHNGIIGETTEFVDGSSQCSNSCLESLVLADNGSLGGSIGNFSSQQELYLTGNKMSGVIPESMGKPSMLCTLDLLNNYWEYVFNWSTFSESLTINNSVLFCSVHNTVICFWCETWLDSSF